MLALLHPVVHNLIGLSGFWVFLKVGFSPWFTISFLQSHFPSVYEPFIYAIFLDHNLVFPYTLAICCSILLWSVSLVTITNRVNVRYTLMTCSKSLLNKTSFLQLFQAFFSCLGRLSFTLLGFVLQNKSPSTEVKKTSSSSEFNFVANQIDFSLGRIMIIENIENIVIDCSKFPLCSKRTRDYIPYYEMYQNPFWTATNCNVVAFFDF